MKLQIEVRNNSITKVLSTFSWFLLETESSFFLEKKKKKRLMVLKNYRNKSYLIEVDPAWL